MIAHLAYHRARHVVPVWSVAAVQLAVVGLLLVLGLLTVSWRPGGPTPGASSHPAAPSPGAAPGLMSAPKPDPESSPTQARTDDPAVDPSLVRLTGILQVSHPGAGSASVATYLETCVSSPLPEVPPVR
jgi:hypothetical protein